VDSINLEIKPGRPPIAFNGFLNNKNKSNHVMNLTVFSPFVFRPWLTVLLLSTVLSLGLVVR